MAVISCLTDFVANAKNSCLIGKVEEKTCSKKNLRNCIENIEKIGQWQLNMITVKPRNIVEFIEYNKKLKKVVDK